MSEGAKKIADWRAAKQHAGYKSLQLWFPIEFVGQLTALAYRHNQDIASYIMRMVQQSAPHEVSPTEAPMKSCKEGHAPYPAAKHGCPTCARNRKRRARARS